MRKWMQVQCSVSGLGIEKLLNAAGKQGLAFRKLQRLPDRTVVIRCSQRDYAALAAFAGEKGYILSAAQPVGLLLWIKNFWQRKGLLIGAALCLGLMIWAMGFLWHIEIENAGAYEGEVRLFLQEMGVQPGLRRKDVDLSFLKEQLEWRLPKVKWVRIEYSGVSLCIRLEVGTPPPDVAELEGRSDLIASEDGLLTELITYAGTPLVKEGDFVRRGQVLIRGEERGTDGQMIPVRARGKAIARIWVTARAETSLSQYDSLPTGRTALYRSIHLPFFSFALDKIPDYLTWDLERKEQKICGVWLPILVRREQMMEIALEKVERNPEEARQEAGKAALRLLQQTLNNENIIDKWIEFRMIEGDTIAAAVTAEIRRDIGQCEIN